MQADTLVFLMNRAHWQTVKTLYFSNPPGSFFLIIFFGFQLLRLSLFVPFHEHQCFEGQHRLQFSHVKIGLIWKMFLFLYFMWLLLLCALFHPSSLRSVTSTDELSSWCLLLHWPCKLFSLFFKNLPSLFFSFLSQLFCLRAASLGYMKEYLFLCNSSLYAPLFLLPLCRRSTLFFSAEVLIKRDSQFNYFYSGALPLESCSLSLSSYIFYLFSAFPPIFFPWLFLFHLILPLLLSPRAA